MKDLPRIAFTDILFLSAFGLGLVARFLNLGAAPLSESEAELALQALALARGEAPAAASLPHPLYLAVTGLSFFLLPATNFLARFWPALAGSMVVGLPYLLRWRTRDDRGLLPVTTAIIISFGLALDPGLVAASRIAGSPMPALAFTLLALAAWFFGKPILAGVVAAAALLSGPSTLLGLLILALSWVAARLLLGRAGVELRTPTHQGGVVSVLSMGIALVLLGTLFLFTPSGLASFAETFPAFLSGWVTPAGAGTGKVLASFVFYQPLALVFFVLAAVRMFSKGSLSRQKVFFLLWAVSALILVLLYPSRQVTDLVWALVPLWSLAAFEFVRYLPYNEDTPIAAAQASVIFVLSGLFWQNLLGLTPGSTFLNTSEGRLRLAVLAGIVIMIAIASSLISLGWGWVTSRRGLTWGITAALGAYVFASLMGATQVRPGSPRELWYSPPGVSQPDLLLDTLHQLSTWQTGFPEQMELVAVSPPASLRWLLRDFPAAKFSNAPIASAPPVIITPFSTEPPSSGASYRGQDFAWLAYPNWTGSMPDNTLRWLTLREAPLMEESILLWARNDLFPGGSLTPEGE